MKLTNHYGFPEAIVQTLQSQQKDYLATRGDADITVTQLLDPPRKQALIAQHSEDLSEDVLDRFWALLGTGVHSALENASTGLREARFATVIAGWKVSGKADLVHGKNPKLVDYKVTSTNTVRYGPREEWLYQLNYLAYLADANMVPVRSMEVVAILRDWKITDVGRVQNYPPRPIMVFEVPWWGREKILRHMEDRVLLHKKAREAQTQDDMPLCTAEERWQGEDKYAVYKEGLKRATAIYDSLEDAQVAQANLQQGEARQVQIVVRHGRSRRCERYCVAAPFCLQWASDPSNPENIHGSVDTR